MAYSKEVIMQLENPYEALKDSDKLAEHVKVLNSLSEKEQMTLATRIITRCPQDKFKNYFNQIRVLARYIENEGSFYSKISDAYQLRQGIYSLIDIRNSHPHSFFEQDFKAELFHRFPDFAQELLKENEQIIAERLALNTPVEVRSKVVRNIDIAFPKSALLTNTQLAFALNHNIVTLLLGDKPEQFFTSADFNKDSCILFKDMFRTLLKGKEPQIAQKLSSIESVEIQNEVRRKLELLHTETFDDINPFKLIAAAMTPPKTTEKNSTTGTNRYSFMSPPTSDSKQLKPTEIGNDSEEELDELEINAL